MEKFTPLSFSDYEKEIRKAIELCDNEKLDLFCNDVISRVLPFLDSADISDLYEPEIDILNILRQELHKYPNIDWELIGNCLDELTKITEQDEEHGIDMDRDVLEFFSTLDSWRAFKETGNKKAVAWVSEHLMNILDSKFVDDVSLENWLSVPELKVEFDRQISFLMKDY